jgi:hypothetical protein
MIKHVTYINKRAFLPVFIVVSDFEIRSGFVDIDGIVDHHGLKTFFS